MNKESLEEAIEKCSEAIINSNINTIDKLELLNNISQFLNSKKYEENIKVLRRIKK